MSKLTEIKVGSSYLSATDKIVTITQELDIGPEASQFRFLGRFQGAVHDQRFDIRGRPEKTETSKYYGRLIRPAMSKEEVVTSLWNTPGQSMEDILKTVRSRRERQYIRYEMMDELITENRVSVLRFTTYAPSLRTTFFYFATEHGRLEIVDNKPLDFAGHQIGHVHDPMGLWDTRMRKALEN